LWERLALALQSHELLSEFLIHNSQLIISYVPSHRYRHYITKGYNQAELLAHALTHALDEQIIVSSLCRKIKNTHSQVGMGREERKHNLTDAFEVRETIAPWSTIIIIDDVLTSGATLIEMAKTIKRSQPHCQVWWLCIARNG
jgi:predicted amidophosphoribosyltransferase